MVAVCLWAVSLSGVAGAKDTASARSLWQWQERYVRIEPQAERDAPPNDHPITLTPQQIGVMLDGLKVRIPNQKRFFFRSRDKQQGVPVFSERELQVLSDALSRGLAQAGPREDIVFVMTGNVDLAFGGAVKDRETNTGRVFFRDGQLNIIFGDIHGEFPQPRGAGALVAYPARIPQPGARSKTRAHEWRLVLGPGMALHHEGDTTRTDWVRIDPDVAMARYEKEQKLKERASPAAVVKETSELAAEQEALRRKVEALEKEMGVEAQGGVPKSGAAAPPPKKATVAPAGVATASPPPESELERRLRVLKRLRDQGLLSEEIYKAQVEEALKEGL
jgi:hypothetical protein